MSEDRTTPAPAEAVPSTPTTEPATQNADVAERGSEAPARGIDALEHGATPGAPVTETSASETEVLRAVARATTQPGDEAAGAPTQRDGSETAARAQTVTDSEDDGAAGAGKPQVRSTMVSQEEAELARRQALSEIDTQMHLESALQAGARTGALPPLDELPSAVETPERDGEIRISADHPMAALYMQTPAPPELRGNRGAGVLIALLATVGFAVVFAGLISLWIAPYFPPSTFVEAGLVPWLTSGVFIGSCVAFFVGLSLLVLIVGRAGWWAYVLGGFFVGLLVWATATLGLALLGTPTATADEMLPGVGVSLANAPELISRFGLSVPALGAAIVAREASVWFGAWIGARGRKMKAKNIAALAEYDVAVAETQTQNSTQLPLLTQTQTQNSAKRA